MTYLSSLEKCAPASTPSGVRYAYAACHRFGDRGDSIDRSVYREPALKEGNLSRSCTCRK
jgi:hypothetical protein